MNILLVSQHPAQVHNFRLVRDKLLHDGHHVFWLSTKKDIATNLLDQYRIPYAIMHKPSKKIIDQLLALVRNTFYVGHFMRKNKIDIAIHRTCPYTATACFFTRHKHVVVDDTEHAAMQIRQKPFAKMANAALVPSCFWYNLRQDMLTFPANIELFYTHPKEFTPTAPWELLGIEQGTPYALVRFVKWDAYHDTKLIGGFSLEQKIELVQRLNKHVKVFISSETELPASLEPYRIHIPIERMHDVLAHAVLFVGESATMASESVCLGTPAIYVDEIGRGYTDEEARAGLLWMYRPYNNVHCTPHDASQYDVATAWKPADPHRDVQGREPWWIGGGISEAIAQAEYIVSPDFDRDAWKQRHSQWLSTKIDPTAFLTWFIENYPESVSLTKHANQAFWQQFK